MKRVVFDFCATPLTCDVQGIILDFFTRLDPWPAMNLSQDVRELVIGADIFGFLWGMFTDKPRYRTLIADILLSVHEASTAFPDHPRVLGTVMMFLAIVTKRHRGRMIQYMDDLPLKFSRGLPGGGQIYGELWYDWGKRCQSAWWEEMALACHAYLVYKGLSYSRSYNNEPLMTSLGWSKVARAIIINDETHARLAQVTTLEEFYNFLIYHSVSAAQHFDALGCETFGNLSDDILGELAGLKNMACAMVTI